MIYHDEAIAIALKPYGYVRHYRKDVIGIPGPGSQIVVFATGGQFLTACLTYDCKVVWVMTTGGQEVDANTDEVNALHARSRELYRI